MYPATLKARDAVPVLTRFGTTSKLELDERCVLTGRITGRSDRKRKFNLQYTNLRTSFNGHQLFRW